MTSHVTRIRHVRQSLHKCLLLTFNSIQKMNWHLRKQQMKRNYRIWFLELCDYFLFNFFIIRPTKYLIFRNLCFLLWISSTAKSSIKMNSALPFYTLYTRHGQSAARGPHAALQTFFAALELKIFDSLLTII
jgi:hypothetical protein